MGDASMKASPNAAALVGKWPRSGSFADRRPDRAVWRDRRWEWAALRFGDGASGVPATLAVDALDAWFFEPVGQSPATLRRAAGAGSIYWLGRRDRTGTALSGGSTYQLTVPQPVPARLFWSVTVYDAETRSQIQTEHGKAALRSLFELKRYRYDHFLTLYFAPVAPIGREDQWIKTIPGKSWFAYFRVYGPEAPAFDGSWKPGDFERHR